jgi:ion channel-forming bestrophin family protein
LFCLSMCRRAVKRCFEGRGRDADAAALRYELNKRVDFLASQVGALERLRATKIPEIYVIHLRTFLFAYLISMPFVFVGRWGWGTIAAVACVSFALLGIEGAATECEIPFSATHANHLRMDQYVMGCFDNVAAMLEWQDERVDGERRGEVIRASVDVGVAIKAESPR